MKLSDNGLLLLQKFEGFSSEPYQDSAGIWTIGYGNTYYEDGTKVKKDDATITKDRGLLMFRTIGERFDSGVKKLCDSVGITLTQNEHDALVCFAYNCGVGALASSTLWKQIILFHRGQGTLEDVGKQWVRWNKAGGKVLKGLTKRREAEFALFSKK